MSYIVLAIDSFKGCLTSSEAELAVEMTLRQNLDIVQLTSIPVSDGGEGMLKAFNSISHGLEIQVVVRDPLMREVRATYGISADGVTAIIEMARCSGITLLQQDELNPMLATSYGTGEMISDAIRRGCRNFIIGLGGSATCDGGVGMMQALGVKFMDERCQELHGGGNVLGDIHTIDMSEINPHLKDCNFILAADVTNPLYGRNGAAYVFGPQKGANPSMVEKLDEGLRNLADKMNTLLGIDVNVASAGAAGGLGAAFIGFMQAKVRSGAELLLELCNFSHLIENADMVITGEGKADRQTLMGKLPFGILQVAQRQNVPVVLLAGRVDDRDDLLKVGFSDVLEVTPREMSLEEAMKKEVAIRNIHKSIRILTTLHHL